MGAIERVASVPGWMSEDDAEKLYELAREASGDILEIGTFQGKSAVLMAQAIRDAGSANLIHTIDVDSSLIAAAREQAVEHGVADRIVFVRGTSASFARAYPKFRPALTFVDGDHSRSGVQADLTELNQLVPAGGRLLFHDFADPLNDDPACEEIKVRPTVETSWVAAECEFDGLFGCCGLFTRRTEPPAVTIAYVDLLRLDDARTQYLQRLRYPAGRVWKRIRGTQARPEAPNSEACVPRRVT
jgi:MMP 1-O-methyltransferase